MTERALLVSVTTSSSTGTSLDELARLADTAGATVIDEVVQRRERLDPATLMGSGRLAELREIVDVEDIEVVIFDEEVTPAQERNLSAALDVRVLDRTALILDIFALHANSKIGRAHV